MRTIRKGNKMIASVNGFVERGIKNIVSGIKLIVAGENLLSKGLILSEIRVIPVSKGRRPASMGTTLIEAGRLSIYYKSIN